MKSPSCRFVPAPDGFDVYAPATLAMIDVVCLEARQHLIREGLSAAVFDLCLGIREALANAVRHGAGLHADQIVHLRLRRRQGGISVTVTDSGPGFDWRTALSRVAASSEEGGRGLAILRNYFSTLSFNEQGNAVTFVKDI